MQNGTTISIRNYTINTEHLNAKAAFVIHTYKNERKSLILIKHNIVIFCASQISR